MAEGVAEVSERTRFRAWVTKYALTEGIQAIWAEDYFDVSDRMIRRITDNGYYMAFFHKPHWHLTEADAVAHAEKMRVAKIKSLQKQIAKLEALKFGAGSNGPA